MKSKSGLLVAVGLIFCGAAWADSPVPAKAGTADGLSAQAASREIDSINVDIAVMNARLLKAQVAEQLAQINHQASGDDGAPTGTPSLSDLSSWGGHSSASITIGDTTYPNLSRGDVAGGWRVDAITDRGVVLSRGGRRVTLNALAQSAMAKDGSQVPVVVGQPMSPVAMPTGMAPGMPAQFPR